jgi:hypothetical protein
MLVLLNCLSHDTAPCVVNCLMLFSSLCISESWLHVYSTSPFTVALLNFAVLANAKNGKKGRDSIEFDDGREPEPHTSIESAWYSGVQPSAPHGRDGTSEPSNMVMLVHSFG